MFVQKICAVNVDEIDTLLLSSAVNFTNISRAAFLCTNVFCITFTCLQFGFVIFCWKEISIKYARKMLSPAFNFTNMCINIERKYIGEN